MKRRSFIVGMFGAAAAAIAAKGAGIQGPRGQDKYPEETWENEWGDTFDPHNYPTPRAPLFAAMEFTCQKHGRTIRIPYISGRRQPREKPNPLLQVPMVCGCAATFIIPDGERTTLKAMWFEEKDGRGVTPWHFLA